MLSLILDGLVLIEDGRPANDFTVETPIEGLDSPEYRINTYSNAGTDGATTSSMFYGSRTISISGAIDAKCAEDYEAARRALSTACAISRDAFGFPQDKVLSFTTMAGESYFVNVKVSKPTFAFGYGGVTNFLINMIADSHVINGEGIVLEGPIYPAVGGGFILPIILPFTSSPSSGGTYLVHNAGNTTALPQLTLNGVLTSPVRLTNQTTGKFIELEYTVSADDTVIIDMSEKSITLNFSSSLISTKTAESDWWGIVPGNNIIRLSNGSSSDDGLATVRFYSAYLGV